MHSKLQGLYYARLFQDYSKQYFQDYSRRYSGTASLQDISRSYPRTAPQNHARLFQALYVIQVPVGTSGCLPVGFSVWQSVWGWEDTIHGGHKHSRAGLWVVCLMVLVVGGCELCPSSIWYSSIWHKMGCHGTNCNAYEQQLCFILACSCEKSNWWWFSLQPEAKNMVLGQWSQLTCSFALTAPQQHPFIYSWW